VTVISNRRHALLQPRIAVPFLLVALIWGSTWFVIKDQLAAAPPSWSVAYRFGIAAAGMFLLAARSGRGFRMTLSGHVLAVLIGLFLFCLNFNLVYRAEIHLTSGIVAVLFGLLMVPNAIFGQVFLGEAITRRFIAGTLVGVLGIGMLLMHEANEAPPTGQVALGVILVLCALISASIANVMQGSETARRRPLFLLLAWAMLWGAVFDTVLAWAVAGPPVFPDSIRYWGGVAYLAIVGSVVTFPLYVALIRELGAGRAAYNGAVVPVVAMALSTFFEGYRWSPLAIAGGVLALVGMVIALRGRDAPMERGRL